MLTIISQYLINKYKNQWEVLAIMFFCIYLNFQILEIKKMVGAQNDQLIEIKTGHLANEKRLDRLETKFDKLD